MFAYPAGKFRGAPFWAWNGRIEINELKRQIRIMHRMGLGGFFMHSRVGLETEYLSDEWFACIRACVEEAEELGMHAWIYDEDRWPSGAGGGIVTAKKSNRMRSLGMEISSKLTNLSWDSSIVAVFTAEIHGNSVRNIKRIAKNKSPSTLTTGEKLVILREQIDEPSSWFNGQTYLDTLNHKAVREFIENTHEAYAKQIKPYFGNVVPGVFTDEPNYMHADSIAAPWTAKLTSIFKKRYGYDLTPRLLELFFNVDEQPVSRTRYHFYDCITFLFSDAFARQISEWCGETSLRLTGHVLMEDTLSDQAAKVGSCMRFYEHMHMPGMDLLTEHWRVYDTAKQVSSVANQFEKKWRLTETYGCTGWDFSFAGHKALGDWQAALGINFRAPHLAWYTMLGEAKRDYPASVFYQSPWWEMYPKVEDYFARINVIMSLGKEIRDVLVIHPNESMWLLRPWGRKTTPEASKYDSTLMALRDALLTHHIDFDYGDEEIMSRHTSIKKQKGRAVLVLGKAAYRAIVIPPLITIRRNTLLLLQNFIMQGGIVVFAGDPPAYVDAVTSDDAITLAQSCIVLPPPGTELAECLETVRRVSISDDTGREIPSVLYNLREDSDSFYLFIVNTGHSREQIIPEMIDSTRVSERQEAHPYVRIHCTLNCEGKPLELDPDSGEIFTASSSVSRSRPSAAGEKKIEIETSLPRLGSRLFAFPKKKIKERYAKRRDMYEVSSRPLGKGSWPVRLSEANVLVLDRPRYRFDGRIWKSDGDILKIDGIIRESLGIPRRGGQMIQPWVEKARDQTLERKESDVLKKAAVDLQYAFAVEHIPNAELFLALEKPAAYRIFLNEHELSIEMECGWWCDRSLRRIRVNPLFLRTGINELRLSLMFDEKHPGLEHIYFLGNFGVQIEGTQITMVSPTKKLKIGNWVNQGLPFYSGSVVYETSAAIKRESSEHIFLQVPEYGGTAVRMLVNGASVGIVAWQPNEVEITDFVKEGMNEFAIEVISHRRNSHGPFHNSEIWPEWTGPEQYVSTGKDWTDTFQLVPCGLTAGPRLVRKKQIY